MKKLLLILFLLLTPSISFSETNENAQNQTSTEQTTTTTETQQPASTTTETRQTEITRITTEISEENATPLTPGEMTQKKINYIQSDSNQDQLPNVNYMNETTYIPIEIRLANIIIDGIGYINEMLFPFFSNLISTLLIILLAFWLSSEAYNMINTGKTSIENGVTIVKKIILVIIWTAVILANPAQVFMFIMGPIIQMGGNITDFIINALTNIPIDQTCDSIKAMAMNNTDTSILNYPLLNPETKGDLLCLTGRISKLYTQFITLGFQWMGRGLFMQPVSFLVGLSLVIFFVYIGFKFTLESLGIILDLILGLMILPFCAIGACFGGGLSYKGLESIPNQLFTMITSIFGKGDYKGLITKIIKAILYFWILSVVVGICYEMMSYTLDSQSGIFDVNYAPGKNGLGIMSIILSAAITAYLIKKAPGYAEKMGGAINTAAAKPFEDGIDTLYKNSKDIMSKMLKKLTSKPEAEVPE